MKRIIKIRSLMLTVVLLLGAIPVAATARPFALNGTGLAGLPLPDDPNTQRPLALKPFSLHGTGLATFITDEAGHVIGATTTGSGTATYLGVWTAVGRVTFTPDENGVIRSSGAATITAANGDTLEVVLEGALDPVTGTDQGVFRFVGGTGRFEGASGSADSVVTINPLNGGFDLTLVGRINF